MSSPSNPNSPANLPPVGPSTRVVYLAADRAPTSADTKYRDGSFYLPNTEWTDKSTSPYTIYKLAQIVGGLATWQNISGNAVMAYRHVSTNYSVTILDNVIGVDSNSGVVTITMLGSPTAHQKWTIKDEGGDANVNNITISGNGLLINAAATYVLTTKYQSVDIYYGNGQYYIS